jgi:hypothetical protein
VTGWSPHVPGAGHAPMVGGVDAEHYAEVELTPGSSDRHWRVRCGCAWTGLWRGSLCDAVAEYDDHLAEYGIFVADGAWWLPLPRMVPVRQVAPDPVSLGAACRIWAAEAVDLLDRLCRWVAAAGDGARP